MEKRNKLLILSSIVALIVMGYTGNWGRSPKRSKLSEIYSGEKISMKVRKEDRTPASQSKKFDPVPIHQLVEDQSKGSIPSFYDSAPADVKDEQFDGEEKPSSSSSYISSAAPTISPYYGMVSSPVSPTTSLANSSSPSTSSSSMGGSGGGGSYGFTNVASPIFSPGNSGTGSGSSSGSSNTDTYKINSIGFRDGALVIKGSHLNTIKKLTIDSQSLEKISGSASELLAMGTSALKLVAGKTYSLVIADAHGSATYPIAIELADGSVSMRKLAPLTNAEDGYVLKWSAGTGRWIASPEEGGSSGGGGGGEAIRGVGLVNEGVAIASGSTIDVKVGTGAGEIAHFDNDKNFVLQDDNKIIFQDSNSDYGLGFFSGFFRFIKTNTLTGTETELFSVSGTNELLINGKSVCYSDGTNCDSSATGVTSVSVSSPLTMSGTTSVALGLDTDNTTVGVVSSKLSVLDGGITGAKLNSMGASDGHVLKWNGSSWAPGVDNNTTTFTESDPTVRKFARSDITGVAPEVCGPDQTMTYALAVDQLVCQNIEIASSQIDGLNLFWETATGGINYAGGNVGIGVAAPERKLHVLAHAGSGAGWFEHTTSSTSGDGAPLSVMRTTAGDMQDGFGPTIGFIIKDDANDTNWIAHIGALRDGNDASGAIVFAPALNGTRTTRMRILSDGKVGIGQSNPTERLEVNGKIFAKGEDQGAVVAGDSTYYGGGKQYGYNIYGIEGGDGSPYTYGVPNITTTTYTAGKAGARFHGGNGGNFSGGGAGVYAQGGNGGTNRDDIEGGAGIYARGGLNGDGSRALAAYFAGNVTSTGVIKAASFEGPMTSTSVSSGNGSVGSPAYSFNNSSSTGFYSSSPGSVSVASGGSEVFTFNGSGLTSPVLGGAQIGSATGNAATPTFSFSGDSDTGWYSPLADTLAAATGGVERMRIDDQGRVGIGATNPDKKFVVRDNNGGTLGEIIGHPMGQNKAVIFNVLNENITAPVDSNLDLTLIGSQHSYTIGVGGPSIVSLGEHYKGDYGLAKESVFDGSQYSSGMFLNNRSQGDMRFGRASDEFMRITKTGLIGVGTTIPSSKMEIASTGTTELTITGDGPGINNAALVLKAKNTGSANHRGLGIFMHDQTGANEWFAGRPYTTSDSFVINRLNTASHSAFASAFHDGGGSPTGTENFFMINGTGNVGIGTRTPAMKLDINGPVKIDGMGYKGYRWAPMGVTDNFIFKTTTMYNGSSAWAELVFSDGHDNDFVVFHILIQNSAGTNSVTVFPVIGSSSDLGIDLRYANLTTDAATTVFFLKRINPKGFTQYASIRGSNIDFTTVAYAGAFTDIRLGSSILKDNSSAGLTVDIGNSPSTPGLIVKGGANVNQQTHLLLHDVGTSGLNRIDIDFAFTNATPNARISSLQRGSTSVDGATLLFETTSNNAGAYNVNQFVLNNDGNVGIGTDSPGAKLHVVGNILASGTITPSDIRLKKNFEPVDNALQKLSTLSAVTYDWKDKDKYGDKRQMGVIAQEVEKVFPEAVVKTNEGILTVSYTSLISPLISAVKEIYFMVIELFEGQKEINRALASKSSVEELEKLRQENEKIKEENKELKARLDKIEKALGI